MVNCMACEWYLDKAILKKEKQFLKCNFRERLPKYQQNLESQKEINLVMHTQILLWKSKHKSKSKDKKLEWGRDLQFIPRGLISFTDKKPL